MYYPTIEKAKSLAKTSNLVPVYREIMADLETPVSAYLKIARGPYSFLLESVEGSERIARYSFIGTEPYKVLRGGGGDPLKEIEAELAKIAPAKVEGLPRFHGGAVGYLTYDAVRHFERLPSPQNPGLGLPESVFLLMNTVVVFDHRQHKIQVVSHARFDDGASQMAVEEAYWVATKKIDEIVQRLRRPLTMPAPVERKSAEVAVESNMTKDDYFTMVARTREYIIAGDIIQGVMSQRLKRPTAVPALDLYRSVRAVNPSPYMFFLDMGDFQLVGASPELLVRVEGDTVLTNPIAGTRRRGATPEEDLALETELRNDKKEQAEHIMLVDLGRNDVGRVSQPGTVKVEQLMDVERYSHVMHLVSRVSGKLKEGMTCYDALRSCFPAGTVSGAPKIRAMEIIAELEPDKRGAYAGAVGYFDFTGNMDTCIAIRTMVVKDGIAYVQAGGGIVYDSQPEAEFQETLSKAAALLRAIKEAEGMEQWVGQAQQRPAAPRRKAEAKKAAGPSGRKV